MDRYRKLGMKRVRGSVDEFRPLLEHEYRTYQSRKRYGTEKPNASQRLYPLPCADTLLSQSRRCRASGGNPNVFLVPRAEPIDLDMQASADFCYIMEFLGRYAVDKEISKGQVADDLIDDLTRINEERVKTYNPVLFDIKCRRTYERWIDKYLDPFLVVLQRKGLAPAQKLCGSVEGGRPTDVVGEIVQADAWRFHLVTLDTTREKYNQMTEKERLAVKRVRRWVVVIIDTASRVILGFSICRNPNEQASLEALRMVFMDKTYLFRDVGIKDSDYGHRCPIHEMDNDCGSEFGKHPFGGSLFSQAVVSLSGSLMNTVAGVALLRGHIERFFWTVDLKWARHLPGYTANNPQRLNDRKPYSEACITDDELHVLFLSFIAEYHKTPHRGLTFRTPSAVWDQLTAEHQFDITQMPSPGQLREACGFYADAKVCEAGIKFAGAVYSNKRIRGERTARVVDRIAAPGQDLEIKVDPFDLGGISVLTDEGFISVPCLDSEMTGKTLRQWQHEKQVVKLKAMAEAASQKGAKDEARAIWLNLSETIARHADVGMVGYTQAEIDRIKLEFTFGKGRHERPYVGIDEHQDPMMAGFDIDGDDLYEEVDVFCEEVEPDGPNSMDRFRSKSKARNRNKQQGEG